MAFVRATNVFVSYPVFNAASRSLKTNILSHLTGGKIDAKSSRYVEVEALNQVSFTLRPGDPGGVTWQQRQRQEHIASNDSADLSSINGANAGQGSGRCAL